MIHSSSEKVSHEGISQSIVAEFYKAGSLKHRQNICLELLVAG